MDTNSVAKLQHSHAPEPDSRSQSSVASANEATQVLRDPSTKRAGNTGSIGRKPPKNMADAQASKILAQGDLWGVRILPEGFDPEMTAGETPTASIIDFGRGESYQIPMALALCGKLLVPEDVVANPKSKYITQATATPVGESYQIPMARAPCGKLLVPEDVVANPKSKYITQATATLGSSYHIPSDLPFQNNPPPSPPNFDPQCLYPGPSFSLSRSPQPSDDSELGSESSADSCYLPSASGIDSLPDFDGRIDRWSNDEAPGGPPSYWDLGQMSLSPIGTAATFSMQQPFQNDWPELTDYANATTSFQNPQAPAPFPFVHPNSVPPATIFNSHPTSATYPVTNTMVSQEFPPS